MKEKIICLFEESKLYEIFQKIFARGIEYWLAMRFFLNYKGGYHCRTSCSSFLPAGQRALKK
jgi:hypothetical protein